MARRRPVLPLAADAANRFLPWIVGLMVYLAALALTGAFVLDTTIARLLAGEINKKLAMKTIEDGWNEITDELGRDDQLKAYRASLGL